MSLLIAPPRELTSLWQAVCETHGLLVRAASCSLSMWTGRLHHFQNADDCNVWIGGLRCMFCFSVVEIDHWMENVQICCDTCMRQILEDPRAAMVPLAIDEIPIMEVLHA